MILCKTIDGKKFCPKSAKDIPEENIKVKWQKSAANGSFLEDGFFEAEIFALAGELQLIFSHLNEKMDYVIELKFKLGLLRLVTEY